MATGPGAQPTAPIGTRAESAGFMPRIIVPKEAPSVRRLAKLTIAMAAAESMDRMCAPKIGWLLELEPRDQED